MEPREWLESGRLQYVTLWALAAACFGLAVADVAVAGFDPVTLNILAAVFAASTAAYAGDDSCCATR